MVPSETALVSSYRPSIQIIPLSAVQHWLARN